ncbi:integrase [Mannheimia granulomatis]|uniref:Integrase n=1 Tax=Mannheimia granulomatis TaxID=85402 RepID=A0A011P4X0_9PAST|nr:integrase [Mannheimia granulomatis]
MLICPPNLEQITRMIAQAEVRLEEAKPILHSEGWLYQMSDFREICQKKNGIAQSMSRKGNYPDNGAMESFSGD